MKRRVAVFGATGSIGTAALDLIRLDPDRYHGSVLTAFRDVEALAALCACHQPELAVIADPTLEARLARQLALAGVRCEVASGPDAVAQAAASTLCDTVVAAIPGMAGIEAPLLAARTGKCLLLANQESAASAGPLLQQALSDGGGGCIPVDAGLLTVFQCLSGTTKIHSGERLTLTGPGGPFQGQQRAELMTVTPEQLCRPTDRLTQRKVAVDAASLMSRGKQLLMLHTLFQPSLKQIKLRVHPTKVQARISSEDGTKRSQDGPADLHTALAEALAGPLATPQRLVSDDTLAAAEKPDMATFRCLGLAYQAAQAGGDAPALLNAANDIAVEAFLAGTLPFLSIADLIEQVLTELPPQRVVDIQTLSERDQAARAAARRVLRNAC